MKRVVLDQGLPLGAAAVLRDRGWDAIHVREIDMKEAADGEILDLAVREFRAVITLDQDFPQILAINGAAGMGGTRLRLLPLR
jgi:predicted nuclease of predicted toxin-antitoxin system